MHVHCTRICTCMSEQVGRVHAHPHRGCGGCACTLSLRIADYQMGHPARAGIAVNGDKAVSDFAPASALPASVRTRRLPALRFDWL